MRFLPCFVFILGLHIPTTVAAQQIMMSGWVDRVDTHAATITLRTFGNPRTIEVAPDAVIQVNGVRTRLSLIPLHSEVTILAARGPNNVLRAAQVIVTSRNARPAAAAPPGSVLTGTLVGMNIPANQITLRTQAGDFTVPMGTAPILINGKRGNTRHLRVGQLIHVERTMPTEGSTDYVTQFVRIMGSAAAPRVGTRTQRSSVPFTSSSFPDQTAPRNSTQRGGWIASRLSPVTVSVDQTELERPGVVVNGRTLLPVRELVEHLGGVVLWDAHQKSVWAAFPAQGRTIQMTLDAPVAHTYAYDGSDPHRTGRLIQVAGLDQPPLLMGGQVYAPVAATTEVAGARLFYRPETRQVVIVTRAEDTAHR